MRRRRPKIEETPSDESEEDNNNDDEEQIYQDNEEEFDAREEVPEKKFKRMKKLKTSSTFQDKESNDKGDIYTPTD